MFSTAKNRERHEQATAALARHERHADKIAPTRSSNIPQPSAAGSSGGEGVGIGSGRGGYLSSHDQEALKDDAARFLPASPQNQLDAKNKTNKVKAAKTPEKKAGIITELYNLVTAPFKQQIQQKTQAMMATSENKEDSPPMSDLEESWGNISNNPVGRYKSDDKESCGYISDDPAPTIEWNEWDFLNDIAGNGHISLLPHVSNGKNVYNSEK